MPSCRSLAPRLARRCPLNPLIKVSVTVSRPRATAARKAHGLGLSACGGELTPLFQVDPGYFLQSTIWRAAGLQETGTETLWQRDLSGPRPEHAMNLQNDPHSWSVTKFGIGQPVL